MTMTNIMSKKTPLRSVAIAGIALAAALSSAQATAKLHINAASTTGWTVHLMRWQNNRLEQVAFKDGGGSADVSLSWSIDGTYCVEIWYFKPKQAPKWIYTQSFTSYWYHWVTKDYGTFNL